MGRGWALIPYDGCPYKEIKTQTHTGGRWCEDTGRRRRLHGKERGSGWHPASPAVTGQCESSTGLTRGLDVTAWSQRKRTWTGTQARCPGPGENRTCTRESHKTNRV